MHATTPAIALALTLLPLTARAQSPSALAEALFNEGRAALVAGDYERACPKLRESDRIEPQPGTKLNLARCEEQRGKLATAWGLYRAVLDEVRPEDARAPEARDRLAALSTRVPKLVLELEPGAPDTTRVRVGGVEVAAAGFGVPLPVDPGTVLLQIAAEGRQPRQLEIVITEGATQTVRVSPGPAIEAPLPGPAPSPTPAPGPATTGEGSGSSSLKTAGWAVGGVGVLVLLAGVGTGIAGLERKGAGDDDCDADRQVCTPGGADAHDTARALLTATTALWVAGGVLTATGIVLLIAAPSDDSAQAAVALTPTGASLVVRY